MLIFGGGGATSLLPSFWDYMCKPAGLSFVFTPSHCTLLLQLLIYAGSSENPNSYGKALWGLQRREGKRHLETMVGRELACLVCTVLEADLRTSDPRPELTHVRFLKTCSHRNPPWGSSWDYLLFSVLLYFQGIYGTAVGKFCNSSRLLFKQAKELNTKYFH